MAAMIMPATTNSTIRTWVTNSRRDTRPTVGGSGGVGGQLLDPLGRDGGDGQPEARDLVREVEAQPARDARRQRGDDDLVEAVEVDRVLHRGQVLADPDHALDLGSGGLREQRQGELE